MKMKFNFILPQGALMRRCIAFLAVILNVVLPGISQRESPDMSPSESLESSEARPAPSGPIQDNSFLIEEAYNQEKGIVQHISFMQKSLTSGDWLYTQTDEWPVRSLKHQLSVTMCGIGPENKGFGLGDSALNYRYQLLGNGDAKLAIAPRLSLLFATGNYRAGRGNGGPGLQTNLPVSTQHNQSLVTHWNAGLTWIPRARNAAGERARLRDVNLGQSVVWLASSRVNALVETLWTSTEQVAGVNRTYRRQDLYVSPGIRWAYNFSSGLQVVPGIGVPIGVGPSVGERGMIFYLSFEHPWRLAGPR